MITRFVYDTDKFNKKTIVGVLEDDLVVDYDPYKTFKLVNINNLIIGSNEHITYNKGKMGYMVFKSENNTKYLDINIFNNEIRINLTSNISYASCFSEEFFSVILDYANYFDYDDPKFIFSGMTKNNNKIEDLYNHFFKSVTDSSYVKINKYDKPYFVGRKEDGTYFLSSDFKSASKISKGDIRKILLINGFIDKFTKKHDLSFSTLKCLIDNDSYIYAGLNPCKISLVDNVLKIETDPTVSLNARLLKNEDIFNSLKDISYMISKPKDNKRYYLEIDGKYAKEIDNLTYELVNNPDAATPLLDYDIELLKTAYKIFKPKSIILRKNKEYYLYYDKNEYKLYSNSNESYDNGKMIDSKVYNEFVNTFNPSFNLKKRTSGNILICNEKYLNINVLTNASFKVLLTDSAYNASLFTNEEVVALKKLLNWDFKIRNIENLLPNDLSLYHIYKNNNINIDKEYERIMNEIMSKKTTVGEYHSLKELRCETEKGALEYLRRFYLKDILDYKYLFDTTLNDSIKNILIIAPKLNLELQALSLSANNKVNVTVLNENKFGALPIVYLNDNVNYEASYRLKLSNLPKVFLDKFDMIVFGKNFDEDLYLFKNTLDSLMADDRNIVFLNTKTAKFDRVEDSIYEYFSSYLDVRRKYFTYEFPYKELVDLKNDEFSNYLYKIGSRSKFILTKYDKEYSYHSIIFKYGKKIVDYYNK